MGTLESEARFERRKGYLQNAVLASLALGGVLALTVLAPAVVQVVGMIVGNKKRFSERTRSVVTRLADKGYIQFVNVRGKKYIRITEAGRRALAEAERKSQLHVPPKKPRRWDKRWRLVVFDIAERRKNTRNRVRGIVRSLGFLRLQDSVWVYPYDCEDLVVLLKAELKIGREVLYAIVEKIENDLWMRKHFGV